MAERLAEGEIVREAMRLFRRLLPEAARLVPQADAYVLSGGQGGKWRAPVSAALIEAFRRRDWLRPADAPEDAFVLSDAGRGWIRRALADADPFGAQHRLERRRTIDGEAGEVVVRVNEGESPLGWLRRRRGADGRTLIDERQFAAGERLRIDFTLAQMTPRMAVDLTAPVVAGRRGAKPDAPFPERVVAAKQRLTRALAAVGPGLSDLLLDVCCHLIGLEAAEREKGWPQRSAKVVLAIALDRLAAHYGDARIVGTGARLRAWSVEEEEKEAREP